jgi:hypothetical protein
MRCSIQEQFSNNQELWHGSCRARVQRWLKITRNNGAKTILEPRSYSNYFIFEKLKAQHSTSESLGSQFKPTGLRGVKIPEIYCQLCV